MRCRITVLGVVQGVGYRPFAARLAEEEGITGSVRNSGGVVYIEAYGRQEAVERLIHRLRSCAPPAARVEQVLAETVEDGEKADAAAGLEGETGIPASFVILESEQENGADVPLLPPDLPVCGECLGEMEDPSDRRYRYPFISCVNCGPRYSIMRRLPYDREHTTMAAFSMCPDCGAEYVKMGDRRRHAQTISCRFCGPQLLVRTADRREALAAKTPLAAGKGHAPCIPAAEGAPAAGKLTDSWRASFSEELLHGEEGLRVCVDILKRGGILALKGIGGYQLACRPDCPEAVERLRRLKGREKKPFAVMFPSMERIREFCLVSGREEALLLSPARPIVLLDRREAQEGERMAHFFSGKLCSESRFLGAFLPYTGLHQLLTAQAGPLVMTSANASGDPILTEEGQMEELWRENPGLLDGMAWNTRRILTPLDDSLMRVTGGKEQMLRRSRGFVPMPLVLPDGGKFEKTLLCMGGDLKSVFCLAAGGRAYLSQYFGDLENYRCLQAYREGISRMEELFGIRPQAVVCDLHPGYVSLAEGRRIAGEAAFSGEPVSHEERAFPEKRSFSDEQSCPEEYGLPVLRVQHHHAHAASVMAEHGLSHCIGVVFDGTGYGTDGHVWGGEFLLCRGASFQRAGHLEEAELCGGDASARDAALNAACHLAEAGLVPQKETSAGAQGGEGRCAGKGTGEEKQGSRETETAEGWRDRLEMAEKALQYHINTEQSSSMGRLFDAVSALLGIREYNTYEGECACALENAAWEGRPEKAGPQIRLDFPIWEEGGVLIAGRHGLIRQLLEKAEEMGRAAGNCQREKRAEEQEGEKKRALAYRLAWAFHEAVAQMTLSMCRRIREKTGEENVALSGGVFANVILHERCRQLLEADGFAVYVNEKVPGNDGGICLGQAWIAGRVSTDGGCGARRPQTADV